MPENFGYPAGLEEGVARVGAKNYFKTSPPWGLAIRSTVTRGNKRRGERYLGFAEDIGFHP